MVNKVLKAEIFSNLLGEKTANIFIYIEDSEIKNCDEIKFLVLKELEPTAQKFLKILTN